MRLCTFYVLTFVEPSSVDKEGYFEETWIVAAPPSIIIWKSPEVIAEERRIKEQATWSRRKRRKAKREREAERDAREAELLSKILRYLK